MDQIHNDALATEERYECKICGVQLNEDGSVDTRDDESADHYLGCQAAE